MKRLGIGFIGSGFITKFHIKSFLAVRNADVRGVWSPNQQHAEEAAALAREIRVGDCQAFASIEEMVASPAIDCLWLCGPNHKRIENLAAVVKTLKANDGKSGKGSLIGIAVEKPLARNVAEAKRVIELIEEAGVLHGYLEDQLFEPGITRGREIVWRRGAALTGRPYLARAAEEHSGPHMPWFWQGDLQGGGVLNDMMCHSVEVARFLLTEPGKPRHSIKPVKVSATIASLKWSRPEYADLLQQMMGKEVDYRLRPSEDFARATIQYVDDAGNPLVAEVTTSWSYVGAGLRLSTELLGPEYSLSINSLDSGIKLFFSRRVQGAAGEDLVEKQNAEQGLMPIVGNEAAEYGYEAENRYFVDCFLDGKQPEVSCYDGLEVTELLMTAYLSAEQERTIDFKPADLASYIPAVAQGTWDPRSGRRIMRRRPSHKVAKIRNTVITVMCFCALLLLDVVAQDQSKGYSQTICTFHSSQEFAQLTKGKVKIHRSALLTNSEYVDQLVGTENGIVVKRANGRTRPFAANHLLPIRHISVIVEEGDLILWIGTPQGLIKYAPDADNNKIFYFAGKRWLPDDKVTGIGFERVYEPYWQTIIWVETPKGFSRIESKPMTLANKSKAFVERIRARHVRWGLTSDSHLRVPGDLSSNQMASSDNDGLWTAMYVAAECFRYKVTGAADARANARQGMQALLRLEEITGIPGFPARSFIKKGVDIQPQEGEWHDTPDGQWRWKGDTSSDEIVGHYFVFPIYYDLVADENEKKQLAATLDRITNHILDNNYQLIDVDGKHTRWGWWSPELIWEDPDETGLRALHLLAHLRTAMHVTQSEANRAKYKQHYDELITKHRYHLLMRNQKINIPGHINHSDDELAFLSYYPLLQYETDPALRQVYVQSLERAWEIERPERNPLWNFIYAAGSGSKEFDRAESIRTLQEIPLDQIEWTVTNSQRLDVPLDTLADRFNRKQALIVLPYDELPMSKWNGNPYRLDGGNGGRSEDDGGYFLLPYWLGRYHKLIGE